MEILAWLTAAHTMTGVGWVAFLIYRYAAERRVHRLAERGNVHLKITMRGTEVTAWHAERKPPSPRHRSRNRDRR